MIENRRPRLLFATFALMLAVLAAVVFAQDDGELEYDPMTCAPETAFYSDAITLYRQVKESSMQGRPGLADLERRAYAMERIESNLGIARLSFEDCARRQMRLARDRELGRR